MKTAFLTILLTLFVIFGYSQDIDYNIYIGLTKKQIVQNFKEDKYHYSFEQKMYVNIDSLGKWSLDNDYYTWMVEYSKDDININALFTFDKDGYCTSYFLLIPKLDSFYNYFQYYSQIMDKSQTLDLTWIEKRHKYYVQLKLTPLTSSQVSIYAEKKNYIIKN